MFESVKGLKFWVFIILLSLLVWVIFLLIPSFRHFSNVFMGQPDFYRGNIGLFIASHIGLISRFFAVILAFSVLILSWDGFILNLRILKLIEASVFLEGTYFVLLLPFGLWWLGLGPNFLGVSFLLQAIIGGGILLYLSFKVKNAVLDSKLLPLIGIGILCYVFLFWINVLFHWFDIVAVVGSSFLLRSFNSWGFLGSMITMSLALIFGIIGSSLLINNKGKSIWWLGLCAIMISVHYLIYIAYSISGGNLDSALALDIWTLPFVGLGINLLRLKINPVLIQNQLR